MENIVVAMVTNVVMAAPDAVSRRQNVVETPCVVQTMPIAAQTRNIAARRGLRAATKQVAVARTTINAADLIVAKQVPTAVLMELGASRMVTNVVETGCLVQ